MMCYLVADHSTENTAEGGTDHLRNVAVGLIIHGNAGRLNCNNFNCLHLLGLVDLVAPVNIGTIHVAVSLTSGKSEKSNCRNQQFCFDHGWRRWGRKKFTHAKSLSIVQDLGIGPFLRSQRFYTRRSTSKRH